MAPPPSLTETRIDRWLWAVRLCPTRTAATDACQAGHVRVNGAAVKPSAKVRPGDRVTGRVGGRPREVVVLTVIEKRVGAPVAATCFEDHSPLPPAMTRTPAPFQRERGAGRPTKRDRRELDRLRGE